MPNAAARHEHLRVSTEEDLMSKSNHPRPSKKRDLVTYAAIVHMKGGPMRDRRSRRALEKKNAWRKEVES
jgi:hypothetical protein